MTDTEPDEGMTEDQAAQAFGFVQDDAEVVEIPDGVQIWTEDDDLGGIPDADLTADQTGGHVL